MLPAVCTDHNAFLVTKKHHLVSLAVSQPKIV